MPSAHIALVDSLADWELGHLLVELRTGRFTGVPWTVVTVAEHARPITTMGGLRLVPDTTIDAVDPAASDLLVLPGADIWDDGGDAWVDLASRALAAGTPVAAICGATAGLARAGLLDDRAHTSAAAEYLAAMPGYRGGDHYRAERAVADGDLITAGPQSPVQFAGAVLGRLGLMDDDVRRAYEAVFADGDPSGYEVLMSAAHGR
jgi:putative intracellular protease/amidase